MAYREKPTLYGDPPTPEERRQKRYLLWLFPLLLLAPNLGRIADALGFKASRETLLYGTIVMGVVCIVGAIISFRSARTMAARDVVELTNPERR